MKRSRRTIALWLVRLGLADAVPASPTTCHLANIAIRLNRTLKWDPESQQIVDDNGANQMLSRPQRKGYEVDAGVAATA